MVDIGEIVNALGFSKADEMTKAMGVVTLALSPIFGYLLLSNVKGIISRKLQMRAERERALNSYRELGLNPVGYREEDGAVIVRTPDFTRWLKERLDERIIGQEVAKEVVARSVADYILHPEQNTKPLVMLFVGETGVGKTETAKALADALSHFGYGYFRINCERITDKHEVSSFFGSPRGYIGSDTPPPFIKTVAETRGDLVLLLDEFEKAHPEFRTAFLSVMDEGKVQYASTGEFLPMERSIIILTSNALRDEVRELAGLPPVQVLLKTKEMLSGKFPPELLGRIKVVVPFLPLTENDFKKVIAKELEKIGINPTPATVEKVYRFFEREGVLKRGVREVVNTIRTYAMFPEELEKIVKQT